MSGCSSAASESRPRTARPTTNRSGGGFALRPNAVSSASRCGLGQSLPQVEHGGAQLMQARVCELHLVLDAGRSRRRDTRTRSARRTPATPTCRRPARRARPAPGSDPPARFQQSIQDVALVVRRPRSTCGQDRRSTSTRTLQRRRRACQSARRRLGCQRLATQAGVSADSRVTRRRDSRRTTRPTPTGRTAMDERKETG